MLDALLEFALELGGEVLEVLVGLSLEKRRQRKKQAEGGEPWEQRREKPPWEG